MMEDLQHIKPFMEFADQKVCINVLCSAAKSGNKMFLVHVKILNI